MYKNHNLIKTPNPDTKIWKYMDLWKFLDLIDTEELYLHRIDLFEDKYEGRYINSDLFSDFMNENYDHLRQLRFVSCFTKSEDENYAMWQIYSNPIYGIAIVTTIEHIIKSLSLEEKNINIGEVNYISNRNNQILSLDEKQVLINCFTKRPYFEYEKEIRIFCELKSNTDNQNSIRIKVNLNDLIKEIYISPFASTNFKNLIELKVKEIGILAPIKKSDII